MNYDLQSDGIPNPVPEHSTLFLTTPLARTESRLRGVLDQLGLKTEEPFPGVLQVQTNSETLRRLSHVWIDELNHVDLKLTKCRLNPAGVEPTHSDFMQTTSLANFIAWIDAQWLDDVLKENRLVTFFQPIVKTSNPSEIFSYECLLRGRQENGDLITPDRLYGAARASGKLVELDQSARLTAIKSACDRRLNTRIFININPSSIRDPKDCLRSTVAAIEATGISNQQFVFEVVESDEIAQTEELLEILEYIRAAGIGVALDDIGAGYNSLNMLAELKPDYIKLDMGLIRNVDRDPYKSRVASKLLELARDLGVQTVAEGVESFGEWKWALQHGADFAQGYLFACPQFDPPSSNFHGEEIVSETEHSAGSQENTAVDASVNITAAEAEKE